MQYQHLIFNVNRRGHLKEPKSKQNKVLIQSYSKQKVLAIKLIFSNRVVNRC